MNKTKLFLISFLILFIGSNLVFASNNGFGNKGKVFVSDKYNCSISALDSWKLESSSGNYLAVIRHTDFPARVYLKAYKASGSPSIDAIILARSGATWENWNLLTEKYADSKALLLAGVREKYSRIMQKENLNEDLSITRMVGVEDIYIKDNIVYIVWAVLDKRYWEKVSADLKLIMQSFYILDY